MFSFLWNVYSFQKILTQLRHFSVPVIEYYCR